MYVQQTLSDESHIYLNLYLDEMLINKATIVEEKASRRVFHDEHKEGRHILRMRIEYRRSKKILRLSWAEYVWKVLLILALVVLS